MEVILPRAGGEAKGKCQVSGRPGWGDGGVGLGGGISRGRSFLEFLLSRGKRTVAGGWSAFVKQHNNVEKDYHS